MIGRLAGGKAVSDYIVFLCPRCGSARYTKEGQKTAEYLRCSSQIRVNMPGIRVLLKTRSEEEAIEAVKRHEMKTGLRGQGSS